MKTTRVPPFVLDDAKFRAAFGVQATSLDEGVAATAAFARSASTA